MPQFESTVPDLNRAARLLRAELTDDRQAYAAIAMEAEHLGRLPHMVGPLTYLAGKYITETAEASTDPVTTLANAIDWLDRISSVMIAAELNDAGDDQ